MRVTNQGTPPWWMGVIAVCPTCSWSAVIDRGDDVTLLNPSPHLPRPATVTVTCGCCRRELTLYRPGDTPDLTPDDA